LLLFGGFPQCYQVVGLAFIVGSDFEDQRIKDCPDPSDSPELFGEIIAPIEIVGMLEDLLYFLKTDAALGVVPEQPALARIEFKSHIV
jgi:hypothetical protein